MRVTLQLVAEEDGAAMLTKAQAEAALHQYEKAKQDGPRASAQFLKEARVVLRNRADAWLKTLRAD